MTGIVEPLHPADREDVAADAYGSAALHGMTGLFRRLVMVSPLLFVLDMCTDCAYI